MSRILRRPMFRGGRVDSRGTGITSGLSYAKGGSVNTPKRGLVNSPGRYSQAADNLQKWKDQLAIDEYKKPGTTKYTMPYIKGEFEKYLDNMYTGDISDVDMAYGMQVIPPMAKEDISTMNLMKKEGGQDTVFDLFYSGQLPGSDKINYKKLQEDQLAAAKLAGDLESFGLDTDTPEELPQELTPAQLENIELRKLLEERMKKGTPEEEIEKNKKIFQEAYGSGVPEDASRMLLSAASRLLEPEATVKSGLGKFFGDESKVESKRGKYKDAATTAAINAYLTGQSSFQKFEDQLKLAQAGIDMKLEAGQPKNLDEALEFFRKTGDKLTSPGLMAKAVDKIYGRNTFAGPLIEDKTQLIIGKVYYADDPNNSSNKVLFLIDENQDPQPIKTVYK